ncbi:regulator of chromosome condensation [Culex quinquefasciatus]|uniref:Regulator of chromosome condensation n=1 Tax=Culex quinquefasciatus TaxID=7176 RepID=B0WD58_CULQU|nr:regulator of chromosome condensation [Culex quinquefasciatus]|eukprot:XP_001846642.1 regulator of chromosome condensation [Culex quinquefasciatus]
MKIWTKQTKIEGIHNFGCQLYTIPHSAYIYPINARQVIQNRKHVPSSPVPGIIFPMNLNRYLLVVKVKANSDGLLTTTKIEGIHNFGCQLYTIPHSAYIYPINARQVIQNRKHVPSSPVPGIIFPMNLNRYLLVVKVKANSDGLLTTVYSRLGPDYPRQSGSDGGKRREDNKFLILGSGMPPRKLPAGRRLPVTNSLSRWLALFVVCSVMCGRGRGVRVIVTPWKKVGPTGDGLWQESPCIRHLGLDVLNLLQKPQQAQDLCPELPFRTRGHELEPATWNWQRGSRTTQLVSKQVQGIRILKVTSGGQHSLSHVEGDLLEATPSRNRNPPPPLSPRM